MTYAVPESEPDCESGRTLEPEFEPPPVWVYIRGATRPVVEGLRRAGRRPSVEVRGLWLWPLVLLMGLRLGTRPDIAI